MNRMGSYVTSLNKRSRHWRESSSKQCQGLHQQANVSTQFKLVKSLFKFDVKILDLLRRFKAGLVKVSASIRGPIRGRPFNEPSKLYAFFGIRKHFKTRSKWSCFEPNQPILTYSPQIECNFNHFLAKQSLNWQSFQDCCPIFHRQRLWTIFLQWAFEFEILSTTFYKCTVLLESWNYKEWNLIFWFLSMCKLRRITHKFNIKPSGLYSICDWFAGVYTSIKTKK